MKQGTDEWHEARRGHITASRFKEVMTKARGGGLSKGAETYLHELIAEHLTGKPADSYTTREMQWGHDHEADARASYIYETNTNLYEEGFVKHRDYEWVGGSPDGSVVDGEGLVEIKCPYTSREHARTVVTKKVPDIYIPQVQGLLWVTGREWCDFISFDPRWPDKHKLVIVRMEREPGTIKQIAAAIDKFHAILVKQVGKLRG